MFKFLKEKVKGALEKFNKDVEEKIPDKEEEIIKEVTPTPKKTTKKETKEKTPKKTEAITVEDVEEVERKGLFGKIKEKITTKNISESKFDELFTELELALLENNVALEVVDKIKEDLKITLVDKPLPRGDVSSLITKNFQNSIKTLFDTPSIDIVVEVKKKQEKPYVICFVGVNGSGKTTTIAKLANHLKKQKLSVLLVAGDTWRAASIQQLEEHGKNLDIRVVKHNYGSDPAAVAFDGIKAAKTKDIDVVLIDTAGRQHSNKDLMREMDKIIRIAKPDLKLFIGESITGNDCTLQAQQFHDTVQIDGIILTKMDIDEKGGTALSISYVTGKPILYIGTGQSYDDFSQFSKKTMLQSLGIDS